MDYHCIFCYHIQFSLLCIISYSAHLANSRSFHGECNVTSDYLYAFQKKYTLTCIFFCLQKKQHLELSAPFKSQIAHRAYI